MAGVATVGGLVSGLQTDDLIQKLVQIEQRPIQQYQAQQNVLNAQLSAYREVNTRLSALQTAAGQLATASIFNSSTAASSNPQVLTATANSGATPGQYTINVQSLAQAHQMTSQSYGDLTTTTVGTGTFSITAAGQTTTITVDSSNNTVGGLRDAINRANTNVGASIVQDGNSSYRLMIYSKQSGTANALSISSSLTGGTSPSFTTLQAAQDAQVTLGSGPGAITTVRSTNSVQDLIPGVTLNLLSAPANTPVTVTVSQDTAKIQDAVQKFVDQYNNAIDYINQQNKFNPDTSQGGTLQGDFTLGRVQQDLQSVVDSVAPGITSGVRSFADVGVTMDQNGKLSLNSAVLQSRLASDPTGVMKVFALTGQATNAGVQFLGAGPGTVVNGSAYAVNITQAATQARVTAGTAQTGALGANETLTINGVDVLLTAGMTQAQVLQAINAQTAATGVTAIATGANGTGSGSYLTFRSASYGSTSAVSVVSNVSGTSGSSTGVGNVAATQASPGGQTGSGTGQAGLDVAGTINGEAATGSGQILTGNSGNANTAGLQLRITAASTGSLGTVTLYDGLADAMQRAVTRNTDSVTGRITGQTNSIQQQIQDLQKTIDDKQAEATRYEDSLRQQFSHLETILAQFQSQSAYLSGQLGSLPR